MVCRDLSAALSRKSVLEVEDTLQSMQEDDLEPGPLAYNTLVVAHIKTGNLDAALDVVQDLQFQGGLLHQQHRYSLLKSVHLKVWRVHLEYAGQFGATHCCMMHLLM